MEKICYCKICGTLDYAHGYCPKCGSSKIVAANHDCLYVRKTKCQSGEFGYDAGLRSMLAEKVLLGNDMTQKSGTAIDNILIGGIKVASIPRVSHIFAGASEG